MEVYLSQPLPDEGNDRDVLYTIQSKLYSTIVLYSRDDHGWWVWSTKKPTQAHLRNYSQPLDSFGQAQTSPNMSLERSKIL